jgi:TDG/mug DNA glycosylase family protein
VGRDIPSAKPALSFTTLPDLLRKNLSVVFVGINPSVYAVEQGHYFARRTNRFWPGFSRSRLSLAARTALGVDMVLPEHDRALMDHGFGFTDVAKRPTPRASDLPRAEFEAGVGDLEKKLKRYAPRVACFHGVTGYAHVHAMLTGTRVPLALGPQELSVGPTRLYVVPNPSGANAHFTPADQTRWYDRLDDFLVSL